MGFLLQSGIVIRFGCNLSIPGNSVPLNLLREHSLGHSNVLSPPISDWNLELFHKTANCTNCLKHILKQPEEKHTGFSLVTKLDNPNNSINIPNQSVEVLCLTPMINEL